MSFGLQFSPFLPLPLLIVAGLALGVMAALLLISRTPGRLFRVLAMALLFFALLNPMLTQEDREAQKTVIAVIIDRSASQTLADRASVTEAARKALEQQFGALKGFDIRYTEAAASDGETDGTHLFEALRNTLSDLPRERIGGALFITDGQVHDIPEKAASLGFSAPVHALITGKSTDRDRRVVLTKTPRFGLVGSRQVIGLKIEDKGIGASAPANVTIRRDGEVVARIPVVPGREINAEITIPHAGANIVEVETSPLQGELTEANNRAVLLIEGIREKLRVLLVSGEPHAGERTWRNLLKSDPGVDLVHFTILRPPEKLDGTPISELALIAFPVRELFQIKLKDFDLIIFDRYAQIGLLPSTYFDNIVQYVRNGGAVLVAAGPEHVAAGSVQDTPLSALLPVRTSGEMVLNGFQPLISDAGRKHPVTRGLPGSQVNPPQWSRFFRLIDGQTLPGAISVLNGPSDKPLLTLNRFGKGRVALLLSDQIWLWARGFEGGGPHLDLLRRLAHWLMKEPDLDEEALRLTQSGKTILIERQTMADETGPITLTSPSGDVRTIALSKADAGLYRGTAPVTELGLWKAQAGDLTRLLHIGPPNPREFSDVISSTALLGPLLRETGGGVWRVSEGASLAIPRAVPMRAASLYRGEDWMGFRERDAAIIKGIAIYPVFAGLAGLLLLMAALTAMWLREGR